MDAAAPAPARSPAARARHHTFATGNRRWMHHLSSEDTIFGEGNLTATMASGACSAAACVGVARGEGAAGFELTVMIEELPKAGESFSFGVGRAIAKEGYLFGFDAPGTCGLVQHAYDESIRRATANDFGERADRGDRQLGPPIREGSLLALHLSARSAEGTRTARFSVDGEECAVFVDIEDDGGSSDWVAGARSLSYSPGLPHPCSALISAAGRCALTGLLR